jgi:peptide/nickel transport system substrate-binding protein
MRRPISIAVAATFMLALAGCGGPSDDPTGSGSNASGGEPDLVTASNAGPMSFDPYLSEGGGYYPFLSPIYDSLILWTSDGQFAPNLATEWSYSEDALSFTLKLRDDVKFSDGAVLDAAAVKANLDRAATVEGPRTAQLAAVESITADDDTTVTIHLSSPMPSLETLLADVLGMMVSPNVLDDPHANPVGTGPYVLDAEATVADDTYTFVKRDDYWDPGHYNFGRYIVKVIPDNNTMYQSLKAGEIDYMGAQPAQAEQAEADGFQIMRSPVNFSGVFLYDRDGTMAPALGDVRVRQALNYAVDREAVLQAAANGFGSVTSQVVPPGIAGYDEALNNRYTYDPDKAKALLAEAGFAEGFTLKIQSGQFLNSLAPTQLIASYLGEVGVTVEIEEVQPNDYIPAMLSGSAPAAQFLWGLQDVYLDSFNLTAPTAAFNPFSCDDPELDALIAESATADTAGRVKAYEEWNAAVVDKGWFLVTHFQDLAVFANDEVTDLQWWPARATASFRDWKPAA